MPLKIHDMNIKKRNKISLWGLAVSMLIATQPYSILCPFKDVLNNQIYLYKFYVLIPIAVIPIFLIPLFIHPLQNGLETKRFITPLLVHIVFLYMACFSGSMAGIYLSLALAPIAALAVLITNIFKE